MIGRRRNLAKGATGNRVNRTSLSLGGIEPLMKPIRRGSCPTISQRSCMLSKSGSKKKTSRILKVPPLVTTSPPNNWKRLKMANSGASLVKRSKSSRSRWTSMLSTNRRLMTFFQTATNSRESKTIQWCTVRSSISTPIAAASLKMKSPNQRHTPNKNVPAEWLAGSFWGRMTRWPRQVASLTFTSLRQRWPPPKRKRFHNSSLPTTTASIWKSSERSRKPTRCTVIPYRRSRPPSKW